MSIQHSIQTYALDAQTHIRLADGFADFQLPTAISAVDAAVSDAVDRWRRLAPPALLAATTAMADGRGAAAVLVTNLPFDPTLTHGPEDTDQEMVCKPSRLSEGLLLGAAGHVGAPYGVAPEGRGLINNLSPRRRDRSALTGLGSREPLDLHIETAAARRCSGDPCADGLALIGLVADPSGAPATRVADARAAFERLSPEDQAVLRQARYSISLPKRWLGEGETRRQVCAIVAGEDEDLSFAFAFYGDMTLPLDAEAGAVLTRFHAALDSVAGEVILQPGMLLLINNRVAGHGRGAFEPSYTADGAPIRWVQRVFWIRDLRRLGAWRELSGRVFQPTL
ncbi:MULTISPECIES: TauD/TfdA family dioxygenase [unclassified Caulobacter]|uniref:TauD/TfdA family dioxygenase n=1 Tax=unclassified Caulobacter TaxID=2648921 RepID=UPI0013747192|nr:TauD/TfdA family dioxygenase [Caulobacter sp. X]